MVFSKSRPKHDEPLDAYETPKLNRLDADPAYATAMALLSAFNARDERRRLEVERLALEAEFSTKPSTFVPSPREQRLLDRLAKLRVLPEYFTAPSTDPAPTEIPSPALAKGVALLQGAAVKPDLTRAERLHRLREDETILTEAIRAQSAEVERIRTERSFEACTALRSQHDAVLLEFFRAAQALASITDRERDFRAAVIVAGYQVRDDILGSPFINAPLALGSERQHDSQISQFRRHLQDRGIIS